MTEYFGETMSLKVSGKANSAPLGNVAAESESELEVVARRIRKAAAALATPLRLPHKLIGCRVAVYWAGDQQWYEATVMKVDFVNNAVLLKYDDSPSADETQWEWEPALLTSMKIIDTASARKGADTTRSDAADAHRAQPAESNESLPSAGSAASAASAASAGGSSTSAATDTAQKSSENGSGCGGPDSSGSSGGSCSKPVALNLSRLTPFNEQCIGRLVAVYWENHGLWYDGVVEQYDSGAGKHSILYSDDSCAWANLRTNGRFLSDTVEGDAMILEQRKIKGLKPKGPQAFTMEQEASAQSMQQQQVQQQQLRRQQQLQIQLQQQQLLHQQHQQQQKLQRRQHGHHAAAANPKKRPNSTSHGKAHHSKRHSSGGPAASKLGLVAPEITNQAVKLLLSIMAMDWKTEQHRILQALAQAARRLKSKDKSNLAAVNAIIADVPTWNTGNALKLAVRKLLQPSEAVGRLENTPNFLVGRRLLIFWPGDEQWYPGRVGAYVEGSELSADGALVAVGMHRIDYDDGESYQHDLREAAFRFET